MERKLYDLVKESQNGDKEVTLQLVEKFMPLLKKYAWKLGYEDAFEDLRLNFLELLKLMNLDQLSCKDDARIVSYLTKSLYYSFIKLSKRNRTSANEIPVSSYLDADSDNTIEDLAVSYDDYNFITKEILHKYLTNNEAEIIFEIFYLKRKVKEIAYDRKISEAAISKIKKHALEKLKKIYQINEK